MYFNQYTPIFYSSFLFLYGLNKFLIPIVPHTLLFIQSSIMKFDIKTELLGLIGKKNISFAYFYTHLYTFIELYSLKICIFYMDIVCLHNDTLIPFPEGYNYAVLGTIL